jgi:hypothetical protein
MAQYDIKIPTEASRREIFFDRNTNKLSYKDDLGIIVPFAPASASFELRGTNFNTVLAKGTKEENGAALVAAYAEAITTNPNGSPKAYGNEYYIVLAPGYYTLPADLAVNTNFIYLVSLTGLRDVFIVGSFTLNVTTTKVYVQGIDTGTLPFTTSGNNTSQIFENCKGGANSFGYISGAYGTYINCEGGANAFGGGNAIAGGIFTNCKGGYASFGGGFNAGQTASGIFQNCEGGDISFAGYGGGANGTFNACTGGNNSYGMSGNASGVFTFCRLTAGSFPTPSGGRFVYCHMNGYPYNAGFIPQNNL